MKNALLGALLVAATIGGSAQKMAVSQPRLATEQIPSRLTAADLTPHPSVKPEDGTQATTFKRVFTTDVRSQFHYWPYGTASNDIFNYDPVSKTLNLSRNKATFDANRQISGVEIGLMRSANNGTSWTFDIIQSTSDLFFGMPTFGFVNPDGGTDASKFATAVYGIRYPMPQLSYGGMSLWNRTSAGSYEMIMSDQQPPATGYTVQFGDLYADNTSGAIHYAGTLDPDATAQYGAYGYFNFNLIVEDFGTFPTIPSQWSVDKFRPSEQLTHHITHQFLWAEMSRAICIPASTTSQQTTSMCAAFRSQSRKIKARHGTSSYQCRQPCLMSSQRPQAEMLHSNLAKAHTAVVHSS